MDGTLPVPIQDFANQIRPVSGAARTSKRRGKAGCTRVASTTAIPPARYRVGQAKCGPAWA
ncbi:hypothetical protein CQ012_12470 [Arthrobacter sp. MYb214]|nr:hypothetical protein CQ016_01790 [Arthrobacter sp. MYb222]PRB75334.1 hypothetical protein CQ012_12470 [Arthrobacter sp. MYb214]